MSLSAAFSLVVLTLNLGGPDRVQQTWPERRAAVAADLKAEAPGVAAFQEVWREEDLAALKTAAGHDASAFAPALGLAVTSRFPVVSSATLDLGGGWGVLGARLQAGKTEFDAYSARLRPEDGPADAEKLGRLFRLAEFVRDRSAGRPFVLLGDLGVASDERSSSVLLDLLEARDLCVSHGDEVCGRTRGQRRVDYALIPYSSRPPREYARAAFTDPAASGDDASPRFGLRASLDSRFPALKPAVAPPGRAEALDAVSDAVQDARLDAEERVAWAGWIPFLGTVRELAALDDAARLTELEEEVHSARLLTTRRP